MLDQIQIVIIGIFALIIIIFFSFVGIFIMKNHEVSKGEKRFIEINAKQFSFDQGIVELNRGDIVTLRVNNEDIEHGIVIPDLGITTYGEDELTFVVTKEGEYSFYCGNPHCGDGHHLMEGIIIVN
jgi:heme/copper-type cytochrome/quinol oxidase subunit 2